MILQKIWLDAMTRCCSGWFLLRFRNSYVLNAGAASRSCCYGSFLLLASLICKPDVKIRIFCICADGIELIFPVYLSFVI